MALIVSANAISVSGLGAGSYGPLTITGTLPTLHTLTAVGGSAGTAQIVSFPSGAAVATVNSPGTVTLSLLPGKYKLVLGGTTAPTNVALFRDGTGGHMEHATQAAAQAQATELNSALQAGDTDQHIAVRGSVSGDLWLVNRSSKLSLVNPFAPVSRRTLQE
jgi:hypothetical protein